MPLPIAPIPNPMLDSLPASPAADGSDFSQVQALLRAHDASLVVLDDDPTGTQTVYGVDVLTEWSVQSLAAALGDPRSCFYILTNTRSRPEAEAIAVNHEIIANLKTAATQVRRTFSVVSRSDSTLRGHFPAETDALIEGMGDRIDGVVVIPAFFEGGRYTIGNVHYVAEGDRLIPAAETEFARDATFGYTQSDLTLWIEERTRGRVPATEVAVIGLDLLRGPDGAGAVCSLLLGLPSNAYVIVNAAAYEDLEVFVHGLLRSELAGKRYVFRTAAGFVRVRAGLRPRPLLRTDEINGSGRAGGLIVVGSYVTRTSEQLEAALSVPGIEAVEVDLDQLAEAAARATEIARVAAAADEAIRAGKTIILYTSRKHTSAVGRAGELTTSRIVSDSLVEIVRAIETRPRYFIAKGGITSSDLAVRALGIHRALVLGQAAPGIPVWRTGAESRFPSLAYVVFPGNVGGREALQQLITRLEPAHQRESSEPPPAILLHPKDNVVVLRRSVARGETLDLGGRSHAMENPLATGHKLALIDIPEGGKVMKFGTAIGSATRAIRAGEHVHVHNMKSDYLPTYTLEEGRKYDGSHA